MNLNKNCPIGGLSWAKVLSFVLLFVVLLYPNGMTGKALIQEGSNPWGIETIGDAFRSPEMERGRATPETLQTDRNFISPPASSSEILNHRAARLLAGLASDIAVEGSLLKGPGTGKLYLPLIYDNFNPTLYAVVPSVQDLTQSEAEAAILASQRTVGNITQGTSPTVPAGKVKSQNPAARLYAAKGTAVDLVISTGPATVNVPDVVNRLQAEAVGLITAAGLLVGAVNQENSGTVPLGKVISQSPPAGTLVAEGTAVNLVISLGKLVALIQVPDTVGQLRADAEAALLAAQLTIGTITFSQSPSVAAGRVISQIPTAGSQVIPGTPVTLVISLGAPGLPPDPSVVAPPLDPTEATTLAKSTEFLYTGPSPIQTGVAPGTIQANRAAVIRGKVLTRDGNPLPGVTITIHNHLEYGQTLSRADGMFDLVVNGGGLLTVNYRKNGYLPVQRQSNPAWQDYSHIDDTVLITQDAKLNTIDLTDTTQSFHVAQGSVITDGDGTRQANLLIPQGTQARVYDQDGTTRPVTSLNLRLTEYTVGSNGPAAMPALLPPASAYTYAVELKAEEATLKLSGKDVLFDRAVPFYVTNFLGFPVGSAVPVGYYDSDRAVWVASENGRVIKILAISSGSAELDTDGDGLADDAAKLGALGITAQELVRLASIYPAGETLWRVQVSHLSTWDCNWPYGPPSDAEYPGQPDPGQVGRGLNDPCPDRGSVIECQNQVLGESLRLAGTPYHLHYRSNRVHGHAAGRTLRIPLSGSSIPGSLIGIRLEVEVAGQRFSAMFSASRNQVYPFVWDGLDGMGRRVLGWHKVTVRIGYKGIGVNSLFFANPYTILKAAG